MSEVRRAGARWRRDSAVVAGRSGAAWSPAPAPADPDDPDGSDGEAADDAHPFSIEEGARYEAVAELGLGGMGRVLTTADRRLRRQVALKQIAGDLSDRPGIERRFAREAWITAALDHPAIVPIFDAGRRPDGTLYYTMRLIRGRTLSAAIREASGLTGRLALLRHFLVTCEALAYAHSQGVVHRDLKPDNILVGEFGETQVVDWGLARRLKEDQVEAPWEQGAIDGSVNTSFGSVIGTPMYMSPEQAEGLPAEPRSDVFSLGVVLYESPQIVEDP